jgi:hypothetical protein
MSLKREAACLKIIITFVGIVAGKECGCLNKLVICLEKICVESSDFCQKSSHLTSFLLK